MSRKSKKTKYINAKDVEQAITKKFGKKIDVSFDKYKGLREAATQAVDNVIDEYGKYLFPC